MTSTPEQASCSLSRQGAVIAKVESTPATVDVRKTGNDIAVSCEKPGYQPGSSADEADVDAWVFGNAVIGGLLGLGVDFATGSVHKYDGQVNVILAASADGTLSPAPLAVPPAAKPVAIAPPPPPVPPAPPPVAVAVAAPVAPPAVIAPAPQAAPPPVIQTAMYQPLPAPVVAGAHRVFGVGVLPVDPSSAAAQSLGLDFGVRVMVVQAGSIAATSGIAAGVILVSLDGEALNQKGDVQRIIASRPAGSIVSVHLVRNGTPMDLATQL